MNSLQKQLRGGNTMKNSGTISKEQAINTAFEFSLYQEIEYLDKLLKRSKLAHEKIQECRQLEKENQQLKTEIEELLKCEEEELF